MGMMNPGGPEPFDPEPQKMISKPKQYKAGTYVIPGKPAGAGNRDLIGKMIYNDVTPSGPFGRPPEGAIKITDSTYGSHFGAAGGSGRGDNRGAAPNMPPMDYSEKIINPEWDAWFSRRLGEKPKTKAKDVQGAAGGSGRPSNRKRAGQGTILTDPLGANSVLGG